MYRDHIKRVLDFLVSGIAIIVLSPIILVTAILVKIQLGDPIIFIQNRPGKNEKSFCLYKFRTMTNDRDESGALLPDEMRLNKFGRILRSTSLDELPELFNILKGEMSLVGPRPLLERYLAYYTEEERIRHLVRPGLTGLAQVNGRNNVGWDERLRYDVEYVKTITFMGDIKILLKTVEIVFTRRGVASGKQLMMQDLDVERKSKIKAERI